MKTPERTRVMILSVLLLSAVPIYAQTATQLYSDAVQAYNQGNAEQAKRKLQLALEVDKGFRPATALLARIAADQRSGGAAPALSYALLERTVVPVEFKDTTLDSALEFLRQRVDESTQGRLKINFVLNLPPETARKKVTLKLERVPVTGVMRYLGDLTGVAFEVQKYAVVVKPAGAAPEKPVP